MPLPQVLNRAGRDSGASGDSEPRISSDRPEVPSFQTVYRSYFDLVWSTVRRLGVPTEALDDVVQEVFIVVHHKLETVQRPDALRSWIYSVARRTASTYRRARHNRARLGSHAGIDRDAISHEPTPLARTEVSAELQLLVRLLNELDETKREVFSLVELEELTVPEVAQLLGIPVNTAYSRLRLARRDFDAALARHAARSGERGRP